MARMNSGRIITGGLVAGLIIFIAEGVTNGAILGQQWKAWGQRIGMVATPPSAGAAMGLWAVIAWAIGFIGVYTYAAVRPRFGPGPMTALRVALGLWIVYWVLVALEHIALGTVPVNILVAGAVGGLVGICCAMLAGAALYKEETSA